MRSQSVPFWISVLIHLVVITIAGFFFLKAPELAVNTGHTSMEVELIQASSPPASTPPVKIEPAAQPQNLSQIPQSPLPASIPPVSSRPSTISPSIPASSSSIPISEQVSSQASEDVSSKSSSLPQPVTQASPPIALTAPAPLTSGKSNKNGLETVKSHGVKSSDEGAIVDTTPDYLSNPPPIYPEASRDKSQEGVVLLKVIINKEGLPDNIAIQISSGFDLLDQSAIKAVHKWRFRPETLDGIRVRSRVLIPVRFQLNN